MSELKTNLQNILQEKEDKIIPGNIKKDIQIFDVIGTYEGSGGDSPLTEEEYNEIVATLKTYIPLEENIVDDNTRCLFHCEDYSNTILIDDNLSHSLTGINITPNGKFNSAIEITNGNYNVTYTNSTIIDYINSGADYTLDFWLNVPETLTHDWGAVASISASHTSHGNFFLHCFPNTGANTYKLKLYAKNADLDEEELEVDLNYNVYNHIAVVKQDYNYSLFANGVKIGTVEWTTSYNSNTRIIFGSLYALDSYYIHEYIDEIRFSDVARYTDSFSVPNTPYGQAVTDNRTLTELIEDLEEEKQLKVLPTNIRNQITILGVTGNLIPGVDTSDANAIASDIIQDKTAYVNGEKLTGALTMFNYSFGDLAEQGYDLSGKSEEDPFVLTVDENGLNIAPKMPDRLSLESGSYFPVGVSNLDIAEEANITSDKIVQGNTIFGVEGTATTGIDTSDATATANDIIMSKTAYAQGQKITGTLMKIDFQLSDLQEQGIDTSGAVSGSSFVSCNETNTSICIYAPMDVCLGNNSYFPATMSNSDVADAVGITADKIVQGNTILGIIGTGGTSGYESLNSIGTSVTDSNLLPESNFVTLSGTVNNTGIITEDVTTFVAGESYSELAKTIGLTADKLVEGNTVLGIAGTAKVGSDIYKVFEDEEVNDYGNCVVNLITSLDTIDINNKTSAISFFRECKNLENINQILNTSNVTSMNSMFNGCTSLVTIPLFDTSSATSMIAMFNGCTSLTTIPQLNTSSVTSMNAMFYGCTSLTTIPQLNTSSVTDMNAMFNGCTSLTTIPQLNMIQVDSLTGMFANCNSLSEESLNNILISLATIEVDLAAYKKTLVSIGLSSEQIAVCITLPSWENCTAKGWVTGN